MILQVPVELAVGHGERLVAALIQRGQELPGQLIELVLGKGPGA